MQRFTCPTCQGEVHFGNTLCVPCGTAIGYDPFSEAFRALGDAGGAPPCGNREMVACNWLTSDDGSRLCVACTHNRTIPDTSLPANLSNWREIELAKRYLFYSLLKWNLPHPSRIEAPETGLAFDFLADTVNAAGGVKRVLTGHDNGLITLNIAEGDDAEREARRTALGEPYRTLIGHMRHEVGHYYWDRLIVDGGRLEAARALFGDERQDYAAALARNYAEGPPPGWQNSFISSYATSHPWEDWAETWAHYIHIVDALETAFVFGLKLRPEAVQAPELQPGLDPDATLDFNPYLTGRIEAILGNWVPLTIAINSINRSMGQPDLYPFVLSLPVLEKLGYIHHIITGRD